MNDIKKKNWIKRHKKLSILIAVILLVVIYFVFINKPKITYVTQTAQANELKQTVLVTGTIETENNVDLNFGVIGKVKDVLVKVNDVVKQGDLLVTLDSDTIDQQILEASASLNAKQASLSKVVFGARNEEVDIAKVKLQNYTTQSSNILDEYIKLETKLNNDYDALQISLKNLESKFIDTNLTATATINDTRDNLLISLETARIKAINATEQVKDIIAQDDLRDIYSAQDFNYKTNAQNMIDLMPNKIVIAKNNYDNAINTALDLDLDIAYISTLALIDYVYALLEQTKGALDSTPITYAYNLTERNTDIGYITTQQTNISSTKIDLFTKKQAWENATINKTTTLNSIEREIASTKSNIITTQSTNSLTLAQKKSAVDTAQFNAMLSQSELDLLLANATSQDVAIAQAGVNQAQATYEQALSKLADYQIKAPFDGTVAKVNYDPNETTGNEPVVVFLGESRYVINIDIPESDIIKISQENPVTITLDAYGENDEFTGKIININPSATFIQDVVYYKVKIEMDPSDMVIKDGMTANVEILTKSVKGAISIPQRSIFTRDNGGKYVKVLKDNTPIEKDVTVGLRGDGGNVQIITGLNEGDEIIILEKEK